MRELSPSLLRSLRAKLRTGSVSPRLRSPQIRAQQRFSGHDPPRVEREYAQELEFGGGEAYGTAGDGDPAALVVDDQIAQQERLEI